MRRSIRREKEVGKEKKKEAEEGRQQQQEEKELQEPSSGCSAGCCSVLGDARSLISPDAAELQQWNDNDQSVCNAASAGRQCCCCLLLLRHFLFSWELRLLQRVLSFLSTLEGTHNKSGTSAAAAPPAVI